MTAAEFERSLRALLQREPFEPFVIEYLDGERVEVDAPYVAFSGGAAGYISPARHLHFFDHTNVKSFHPTTQGARP
jgi:hypothetical protein